MIRSFSDPCRSIVFIFLSGITLAACSTEKLEHITAPKGVEYVDAGKAIVRGLGACGFCHGSKPSPDAPLSGGQVFDDIYGEADVPNITPHRNALGQWSTDQLLAYFRFGHNRDGEWVSQEPHRGMEWMADEDIFSVIAYLRTLPAVKSDEHSAHVLTFLDRNTSGFFVGRREINGFVPPISKKSGVRYGQYLVENVANCGRCHNAPDSLFQSGDPFSGGQVVQNESGSKEVPDITNANAEGVGGWNEEQIIEYLQTGKRPGREKADPEFCPIGFYRLASPQDLRSVAQYLKSVVIE